MLIDLTFDLRNPRPWRRSGSDVHREALEHVELAEAVGLAGVWFSEHHRFDDGYLPQPLVFAAAAAARTRRVAIGTSILVLPLHHPVEVAEQAAVVDLISGGRLQLGIGAGYRIPEFELFGTDRRARWAAVSNGVEELRRLWRDGGVTPEPTTPDIPIWIGAMGPVGARRAGRLGAGLLNRDPALVAPYVAGLTDAGLAPDTARIAGRLALVVADDPEAAWVRIRPHLAHQWDSSPRHGAEGTGEPAPPPIDPDAWREPDGASAPRFRVVTAEQAITVLREEARCAPLERVQVWASVGAMPDDLVRRHIELLGSVVAPAVAADDPVRERRAGLDTDRPEAAPPAARRPDDHQGVSA